MAALTTVWASGIRFPQELSAPHGVMNYGLLTSSDLTSAALFAYADSCVPGSFRASFKISDGVVHRLPATWALHNSNRTHAGKVFHIAAR